MRCPSPDGRCSRSPSGTPGLPLHATPTRWVTPWDATLVPIPQKPSMRVATMVAASRSPETPEELSLGKNIRSPTRLARLTTMSDSYSERHRVNWSSGGIDATMPR